MRFYRFEPDGTPVPISSEEAQYDFVSDEWKSGVVAVQLEPPPHYFTIRILDSRLPPLSIQTLSELLDRELGTGTPRE